ncbi:hypothetical protein [Paraburkholderia sp. 40]
MKRRLDAMLAAGVVASLTVMMSSCASIGNVTVDPPSQSSRALTVMM